MAAAGMLLTPTAAAVPGGCLTTQSSSDFNGDGFDDAAVGDPYAAVNVRAEAGTVTLLFGDTDGRIGEGGRRVLTQADVGETPEAGDHFGWDLALTRIDVDSGCAYLLVGSPGEDLAGKTNAGMAHLASYLPPAEGTPATDTFELTQADAGGSVEAGDEFGSTVAVSGITQADPREVIIAAPGEDIGAATDAGAVNVFLVETAPRGLGELQQGKRAPLGAVLVPGIPQAGDRFGASLAVGLLDLPERTGQEIAQGLIIGAPGDTVAGLDGAGSITVLQEEFESVSLITQDSPGVPGGAEAGDQFGFSLALSPRVGTSARTLAVGAPGEDAGPLADAGSVTLFSNANEQFVPRTSFSQATAGVPGANEAGDRFGYSLAFGHRTPTLLVGVPTENIGSVVNAGAVQPVRVPGTGSPLQFPASITENAAGTPGSVGTSNQFGRVLGALFGQQENILTISSVFAGSGSVYVLSDGSGVAPRGWIPGRGGIPAAGPARFGWSVSN